MTRGLARPAVAAQRQNLGDGGKSPETVIGRVWPNDGMRHNSWLKCGTDRGSGQPRHEAALSAVLMIEGPQRRASRDRYETVDELSGLKDLE